MDTLQEGQKAPEIRGIDQHGKEVSLSDFSGKKLILYFYPKDNTPGCTAEACNLRDNYQVLLDKGFAILGVSADDEKKHLKFADKYELPFQLLADTERKVIEAYKVWGPKKFMGKEYDGIHRKTFVIDEIGNIQKIFDKVKTKAHSEQILEALDN
ncbi:MAG TPA: thioredoxin-dependent thiol peroxidase [Flavobacteriales bacterium]|jgi:peroxiredoxin Q/BCP|nr:thioredoxin-dependent thiol peroxidase [Salibacteraceae bacterium]HAS35371.1 thioredoxin-dependent thiol peroxidase [Flavobacteriales bacterium]